MIFIGNIIDLHQDRIFHGELVVESGIIVSVKETPGKSNDYIMPGFIDAHVHIESSMLVPSEFARLAVVHGTVATVSDPHEIANVMGVEGVHFMIENAGMVDFKFHFGAPSCVPASSFETAGAHIDAEAIEELLKNPNIYYLTEMMNYPGVLSGEKEVMKKIRAALHLNKTVDGHAPGLRGKEAKKYFISGISTDHECFTLEEALEKAKLGVHILIREGSAAKNFDTLIPLLRDFPKQVMFCSDDKHPDELVKSHINRLVARARSLGYPLLDILKAACLHPVQHYHLPVGTLQEGDPADFIITDDLQHFKIRQTWINGTLVAENGGSLIPSVACRNLNRFDIIEKKIADFQIPAPNKTLKIKAIKALDGQLVTEQITASPKIINGNVVSDMEQDILKFTVVNRYCETAPALAFIHGFNLKDGAIASCVGHDSHNILAIGTDDKLICKAVNLIIQNKGGIAALCNDGEEQLLALPVGGIMTTENAYKVAQDYSRIDAFVKKKLSSTLSAPFMTLSFMALLVIPQLKLSDKGLFDANTFDFTNIFISENPMNSRP